MDALDDAYSGLDSVLVNGWDIGVVWRAKIRRMNTRRQQRERRQPERQPEQLTPLDDLGLPKWVTAALSANRVPVPDDAPARPKRQRRPQKSPLADRLREIIATRPAAASFRT